MNELNALTRAGWSWHDNGALVHVTIGGREYAVFVPLADIEITFGRELASVGCPLCALAAVGGYQTVGGWWQRLKHSVKRASRAVRKAVPKSVSRAVKTVVRKARHTAQALSSPTAQGIVLALGAAVPVLAPAAGAVLAAQQVTSRVAHATTVAERVASGALTDTRAVRRLLRRGLRDKRALALILAKAKAGNVPAQRFAGALALVAGGRA